MVEINTCPAIFSRRSAGSFPEQRLVIGPSGKVSGYGILRAQGGRALWNFLMPPMRVWIFLEFY